MSRHELTFYPATDLDRERALNLGLGAIAMPLFAPVIALTGLGIGLWVASQARQASLQWLGLERPVSSKDSDRPQGVALVAVKAAQPDPVAFQALEPVPAPLAISSAVEDDQTTPDAEVAEVAEVVEVADAASEDFEVEAGIAVEAYTEARPDEEGAPKPSSPRRKSRPL